MKKILIMGVIIISIFLIYLTTIDKKVYYLALGDSLALGVTPYGQVDDSYTDYVKDYLEENKKLEIFVKNYATSGYRITDVINDINSNKKALINGKEKTLKNALIKADLVTISIGANDLISKINITNLFEQTNYQDLYNLVDEIVIDLEKLFKLLREYCKEDIIMIGYYYPLPSFQNEKIMEVFTYMNSKFKEKATNSKINYVDISGIFVENPGYLPNPLDIHPSKEGYKAIADQVIVSINNTMLKK